MIKEEKGNLFEHIVNDCIIPHVTNDCSAWGAGFVLAIDKYLGPKPRQSFINASKNALYDLGDVDYCYLGDYSDYLEGNIKVTVANMCGQHGVAGASTGDLRVKKPIRYSALVSCMENVKDHVELFPQEILCPRFGSALAGGSWDFIRELIDEIWGELDVKIYTL